MIVDPILLLTGAIGFSVFVFYLLLYIALRQDKAKKKEAELEREKRRIAYVEKLRPKIGDNVADSIIARQVGIGWHPKLVKLSWGKPTKIDNQEITASGINKERWVYGVPKRGSPAQYIYFKNKKVDKIKS